MKRRAWMAGGATAAVSTAALLPEQVQDDAGRSRSTRRFPDVSLDGHDGNKYRLYNDLIKDRIVMFNFMYLGCGGVCPLVTANLVEVQKQLGERVGSDIFMYSLTLQPELDRPEFLRDYAIAHDVGPGWLFLTGRPAEIEQARRALGFASLDPELDVIRDEHTGLLRYGNDRLNRWAGGPALSSPEWIVKQTFAALAVG